MPFRCLSCGGAFFQRSVSDSTQDDYWQEASNEQVYTLPGVRHAFAKKYGKYLARWNRGTTTRQLLEIGCGSGIFLETASRYGWEVWGSDISDRGVRIAKRFCPTAKIVCAPLEKAGFPQEAFDLIALWDVIEHVAMPDELIGQVWKFLRPGGRLVMETPDEGCVLRHLIRLLHRGTGGTISFLRFLYYPAHQWYFTKQAMTLALERVGFQDVQFFRERTVKEFGSRKATDYGLRHTYRQRLTGALADAAGFVPYLRNKMVVVAVRPF